MLNERFANWKCPRGYVDDVAAAIAIAVVDDRATGRVYNVGETPALTETEWIRRIATVVEWNGKVLTVPEDRIPMPFKFEQSLDTDSALIRRELAFTETVSPHVTLERTVSWERAHPVLDTQGIGLLDYDAEEALLTDIGRG
jgi:nucleoside-diphosphate-sugar epimerase